MKLISLGWFAACALGCSNVVETDGENYRRASTARDRDRLRSEVLSGLGWNLLRVWAVDWWRDADAEVERLHPELTSLQRP